MDEDANKEIVKSINSIKDTADDVSSEEKFAAAITKQRENRPLYKSCDQSILDLGKTALGKLSTPIVPADFETGINSLSKVIGDFYSAEYDKTKTNGCSGYV